MSKGLKIIAAAVGFSLMSAGALADHRHRHGHDHGHDRRAAYLVGGALVGVVVGGLIYADRYGYKQRRVGPSAVYYSAPPRHRYRAYSPRHARYYRPVKHHRRHRHW